MVQKFNLHMGKSTSSIAGDELKKIEIQGYYNSKIVPYEKMRPSKNNNYPIDSIEDLKNSIKNIGLFHNLVIKPLTDNPEYEYEILSGERRHLAIGQLLEEGDKQFKAGIPSRVIDANTSEIDQKIIIEEANIIQRKYTPETIRSAVARLQTLYEEKNEYLKEQGENTISVTKEISNTIGMGERQVQRYKAVNNKLIPELQALFDTSRLDLKKAAQFANFDEETQSLVVQLLEDNKNITKKEIEFAKEQAKEISDKLKKSLSDLENLNKNNEILTKQLADKEDKIERHKAEIIELNQLIEEEQAFHLHLYGYVNKVVSLEINGSFLGRIQI